MSVYVSEVSQESVPGATSVSECVWSEASRLSVPGVTSVSESIAGVWGHEHERVHYRWRWVTSAIERVCV